MVRKEQGTTDPKRVLFPKERMNVMNTGVYPLLPGTMRRESRATEQFYTLMRPAVLGYCRSRWVSSDYPSIDAEDITQETMLKVMNGLGRFQDNGAASFVGFVFTVAQRSIIDAARKKQRDVASPVAVFTADSEPSIEPQTSFDPTVMSLLREEIAKLPGPWQDVIGLVVLADLDIADAAQILGKSTGNIRIIKHRALTRLQDALPAAPLAGYRDPFEDLSG